MGTRRQTLEKDSRCWPGYEPVPGKSRHQEGSCRKKVPSKTGGMEVDREAARRQAERLASSDEERAEIMMKSSDAQVRARGRRLRDRARGKREGERH
jgi:hypothetical protein